LQIVCDRPITIGESTYRAGETFETEDWRGRQLIENGAARHARPPRILYESTTRKQDAAALGEQGVTCLCLTRNRREFVPKAIRCYQEQAYQNRELLIVSDGEDVRDLIPDDETIRHIHIEEGYTIGEKRNFGVSQAHGEFVAHWDDDDYSAPGRLDHQLSLIGGHPVALVAYHEMYFTDGSAWWKFSGDKNYGIGTSFFYRRDWAHKHCFLAVQIGEDGEFQKYARQQGQLFTVEAGEMMYATNHNGNTSPRILSRQEWHPLQDFTFPR
jgi:glycosyltransferase involved in cell wall biosynthesis